MCTYEVLAKRVYRYRLFVIIRRGKNSFFFSIDYCRAVRVLAILHIYIASNYIYYSRFVLGVDLKKNLRQRRTFNIYIYIEIEREKKSLYYRSCVARTRFLRESDEVIIPFSRPTEKIRAHPRNIEWPATARAVRTVVVLMVVCVCVGRVRSVG